LRQSLVYKMAHVLGAWNTQLIKSRFKWCREKSLMVMSTELNSPSGASKVPLLTWGVNSITPYMHGITIGAFACARPSFYRKISVASMDEKPERANAPYMEQKQRERSQDCHEAELANWSHPLNTGSDWLALNLLCSRWLVHRFCKNYFCSVSRTRVLLPGSVPS